MSDRISNAMIDVFLKNFPSKLDKQIFILFCLGQLLLVEIDGLTFRRSFRDDQPVTDLKEAASKVNLLIDNMI